MKNKMISNSEPLKRFSSYDLTDLQTKQLEINRLRLKIERNKKYQLCREMAYMVDKYGDDVFEWIKGNETKFIKSQKFLKKHFLRKETRAKMVDWMLEVFYLAKSDHSTFELAVHIMDKYISMTKNILYDSDIHLIGLTCIYISSKMMDNIPLKIIHILNNIGRGAFLKCEIVEKEKEISKTINYDFIITGIYDFLLAFFYDLNVNYYIEINRLNGKEIINDYMNFCIILSKLILYNEEILSYKATLISVAILSFGLDILGLNEQRLTKDLRKFLMKWINCIKIEMEISSFDIIVIYNSILNAYKVYLYQPNKKITDLKIKESGKGKEKKNIQQINLLKYYNDKILY